MYFQIGASGNRHGWKVDVKASALLENCSERIAYHAGRVKFWEGEFKAAEDQRSHKLALPISISRMRFFRKPSFALANVSSLFISSTRNSVFWARQ